MTRPVCGKVEFLSGFAAGPDRIIKIDGPEYAAAIDLQKFPLSVGSIVEYRTDGKRAEITGLQQELLPMPEAANLFNSDNLFSSSCTNCIGTAGDCSCLTLQSAPARTAPAKRTDEYTGPFPRKRHSHRCLGCSVKHGQRNAVGCYKQHCTRPQTTQNCGWCE